MADISIISIDGEGISAASAQASSARSKISGTAEELSALKKQLASSQNSLEDYFGFCFNEVIPTKELQAQSLRLKGIVSALEMADELKNTENSFIKEQVENIQLIVSGIGSLISIIAGKLTGDKDGGDGYAEVEAGTEINKSSAITKTSTDYKEVQASDDTMWFVSAYTGDYDKSIWPSSYSGGGCSVASTASALSCISIQVLPKELYALNGNSLNMSWAKVAKKYGLKCTDKTGLSGSSSSLDDALELYLNNPDKYSPPILGFHSNGNYTNHYVVVLGKNEDGTYNICDSSGYDMTTFSNTTSSSNYKVDTKSKTFTGKINQVIQYSK